MSKVTILTKPNRIVIASKGVQGPPGPMGPEGEQGIQGPKGDTGDVTPEALAARDAAQEAATTASTAAGTATGAATAASGSASAAAASANLAEQARLLGATIGFATKADMDASLAHPDGTLALVTSDATAANNGAYRKTGASGSGSWVQSADRVTGLEGEFRSATTALDVSATTGNFAMTLAEAIAAVPASLRKTRFIVQFNRGEEFQFLSENLADWTNIAKWLRPVNALAEGAWNLVDERMLYRGFCFNGTNAHEFHPDNSCLIIPIHRFYDGVGNLLPLTIHNPGAVNLGIYGSGFISASLVGVAGRAGYDFSGVVIPPTAAYAFINVSRHNGTETLGLAHRDTLFKTVRYARQGLEGLRTDELNRQESLAVEGAGDSPMLVQRADGTRILAPRESAFTSLSGGVNGSYLWQIFPEVVIREGRQSLISAATGLPRRMYVSYFTASVTGLTVRVSLERYDEAGVFDESSTLTATKLDGTPRDPIVQNNDVLHLTGSFPDGTRVRLTYIPERSGLVTASNNDWYGLGKSDISPRVIAAVRTSQFQKTREAIYTFEAAEVSGGSNYNIHPPPSIPVKTNVHNGAKSYSVQGTGLIHQQACLIADKETDITGIKTFNVFASPTGGTPQPALTMMREQSADRWEDSAIIGVTEGQWVHPDICYCGETGVGGYKYWMVNSTYPFAHPRHEDTELFVSNDGVAWTRIRAVAEIYTGPVSLRLPPVHWPADAGRHNLFVPIPNIGATMEFATASAVGSQTIHTYLNHDPAILFHAGYVNVYVSYNFGLGEATKRHRYVVCYRTANGVDWQIVREDGSAIPYNAANAVRVFSSDDGVRNHVRYINTPSTTVDGRDVAPSIVKVSDTEFYWYATDTDYTVGSGHVFGLVRYAGTSPYTFNFASRQVTVLDKAPYGRVWHTCVRYYGGSFYAMYDGNMAVSADGLNFTSPNYPFFWRGAQAELYKPAFVVGGDGKVKIAQGLQVRMGYPDPSIASAGRLDTVENWRAITQTAVTEYASLANISARGAIIENDAYADVVLSLTNERNMNTRITVYPAVRGHLKAQVEFMRGDKVHMKVYCNTRGMASLSFLGAVIDERA